MAQSEEAVERLRRRCAELEEEAERAKWRRAKRKAAGNEVRRMLEGREWNGSVPWNDERLRKRKDKSNESNELNELKVSQKLKELNESHKSNKLHQLNEPIDSHPSDSPNSSIDATSFASSSLSDSQSTPQNPSESTEAKESAFSPVEWSESLRTASSLQFMNQLLIQQLAEERKRSSEAVSSEIWKQTKEESANLRRALEEAKKENEELRTLLSKTDLTDYQLLEDSQEGSEV